MKFVPASGAATRMFQSLLQIFYLPQYLERDELQKRMDQGVSIACDFKRFVDEIDRFPFVHNLREVLACDGYILDEIVRDGHFRILLEYLLTERGLSYGNLPKALLLFHSYPEEHRTAFEEQLAESVTYLGADSGKCSLHFTIPEEHETGFQALKEGRLPPLRGSLPRCFRCFLFIPEIFDKYYSRGYEGISLPRQARPASFQAGRTRRSDREFK